MNRIEGNGHLDDLLEKDSIIGFEKNVETSAGTGLHHQYQGKYNKGIRRIGSTPQVKESIGLPSQHHQHQGRPRLWLCRLAVALTQTAFVVGSIYLKGSLQLVDGSRGETFNPLVYAFLREISAGPLLYGIAFWMTGQTLPMQEDIARVFALGFAMYASQLFYIKGIQLSGVVVATCLQPTIPVMVSLMALALKMETANPRKLIGIFLATCGAIIMVLGNGLSASNDDHEGDANIDGNESGKDSKAILGNFFLVINTMAMACYYILSKRLVTKYSPILISAWSYMVAAFLMGLSAMNFTVAKDWNFPKSLILPLLYWIFVCSVAGYAIVTWAVKFLPASQVASFQCLQPFLGTTLAFLLLHEHLSFWDLGAFGVLAGLMLVTSEKSKDSDASMYRQPAKRQSTWQRWRFLNAKEKDKTRMLPLLVFNSNNSHD